MFFNKKEKSQIEYNPKLIRKIQAQGGVKFDERIIKKGDGFEAVVHLYDYKPQVNPFWLIQLTSMKNVITTIDIGTEKKRTALKQINKSLIEQRNRYRVETNEVNVIEAQSTYNNLHSLAERITNSGEVIKLVHIRYYVSAKTQDELEKRVKDLMDNLENLGYRATICLNEQEYEWQSLFNGYMEQLKFKNKRTGKAIPSTSLGGGYFFHFTQLNDPTGVYMGTTTTGGNVIFNLFTRTNKRKSFNALLMGMMGAGKSTVLKKIVEENAIQGQTIRILDIAAEFKDLVRDLGGKTISLDGTDGLINPLQIFATIVDEKTYEVDHEQSYTVHLSKVSTMYRFFNPSCSYIEQKEFKKILGAFYNYCNIKKQRACSYEATDYPTMSMLLDYIKSIVYSDVKLETPNRNLTKEKRERLDSILLNIESIVTDYGSLFDGHSTVEDITNEPIISFDLRNLTQYEQNIFEAQLYNIISLIWNNALVHGRIQKDLFDRKIQSFDDSVKFLFLIDEAHRVINSSNPTAVDYLISFQREARKYFGGLVFATQSIRDIAPPSLQGEMFEKIKTMFDLSLYKFILQQDANTTETFERVFVNQLSKSEIESIPKLGEGECILSINGLGNISFNVEVSSEELDLFKGGA